MAVRIGYSIHLQFSVAHQAVLFLFHLKTAKDMGDTIEQLSSMWQVGDLVSLHLIPLSQSESSLGPCSKERVSVRVIL